MIHLARDGKVHQIEESRFLEMQKSGELRAFSYIWDSARKTWSPIEAPPDALQENPEEMTSPPVARNARQSAPSILAAYEKRIEAVCYDQQNAVSGVLQRMTDAGCELITQASDGAVFKRSAQVLLNVLDPATGRSMNVRALLEQTLRDQGHWTYRLRWAKCPEIIAS